MALTWQVMLTIVMLLDGLWNARVEATPEMPAQWEPTKDNLIAAAKALEGSRDGMNWQEGVREERILLRWIPGCREQVGATIWECVEAYNGHVYPPSKQPVGGYTIVWYSIPGVPSNIWLGATGGNDIGCKRLIAINQTLRYAHNPFYGTPIWIAVVAHEQYHVNQSGKCNADINQVETAAVWGEYEALYNTWSEGGPWADSAYAALIYALRRDAINTTIYLMLEDGVDWREELLPKLNLSPNEQRILDKISIASLYRNVPRYNLGFFTAMLNDEDKVLENSATLRPLDLSGVYQIIQRAVLQEAIK